MDREPALDTFRLRECVAREIDDFEARWAPGFRLPRTFGGHVVGTDAVADLAFTLGFLREGGVTEIGGLSIDDAIREVLRQIDGPETHSFFSYRVAETIGRYGAWNDNALLGRLAAAEQENLRIACDSTALFELLDAKLLPPNYLAVLARCELGRERLGIGDEKSRLDELVERTHALLTANPRGYLDESHDGGSRYDIYTADLYLFCEPLADRLGDAWTDGMRNALELVRALHMPEGAAVPWGRSTGILAEVLTIELAAVAVGRGLTDDPRWWLTAAARPAAGLWAVNFTDGLINAHQHRTTEDYRGPQRRLQMSFDVLGKMAEASLRLPAWYPDSGDSKLLPHRDELIRLDDRAAVWTFRNECTAFVVPFVGGRSSDYLPAPRNPGVFETPVDSVFGCFVPIVHTPGSAISPQGRFAPGEAPTSVERAGGAVEVHHDRFVATRAIDGSAPLTEIGGRRTARYSVDGAALVVDEHLELDDEPHAVSILVPQTHRRPLRVTVDGPTGTTLRSVPVDGMKEWAAAWSVIDEVIEIEVPPSRTIDVTWGVAPKPVVSVPGNGHHYIRSVYDPICDPLHGRVAEVPWTGARDEAGRYRHVGDVIHIHWPEWCFGFEATVDDHRSIAEQLARQRVKVAWTQHNLTPHLDQPEMYDPIYQVWADACDLAIHHSEWGRAQVLERYRFRDDCRHVVIPHPHFGAIATPNAARDRDEAAAMIGLETRPAIRVGMIGAPRKQKDLRLVMDALTASGRDDIELVVWSMSFTDVAPDDPRVVAHVYEGVARDVYDLRLAACDAIALPFTEHTMLATGTASDLVATGTPGLVSDWPYLTEHLGGLGIGFGDTLESWTEGFRALDRAALDRAAAQAPELRDRYDPAAVGAQTADAIEGLGVRDV